MKATVLGTNYIRCDLWENGTDVKEYKIHDGVVMMRVTAPYESPWNYFFGGINIRDIVSIEVNTKTTGGMGTFPNWPIVATNTDGKRWALHYSSSSGNALSHSWVLEDPSADRDKGKKKWFGIF